MKDKNDSSVSHSKIDMNDLIEIKNIIEFDKFEYINKNTKDIDNFELDDDDDDDDDEESSSIPDILEEENDFKNPEKLKQI